MSRAPTPEESRRAVSWLGGMIFGWIACILLFLIPMAVMVTARDAVIAQQGRDLKTQTERVEALVSQGLRRPNP